MFRPRLILILAEGACFNTIKCQLQTSPPTIIRSDHWSCRKLAGALGVSKDGGVSGVEGCRSQTSLPGALLASDDPISNTRRDEGNHVNSIICPCVPGHEIGGRGTKRGADVSRFDVGDVMGVGCVVAADHTCPNCREGFDQFCPNSTYTYNSPNNNGAAPLTYGGYSESMVVHEAAVLGRTARTARKGGATSPSPTITRAGYALPGCLFPIGCETNHAAQMAKPKAVSELGIFQNISEHFRNA